MSQMHEPDRSHPLQSYPICTATAEVQSPSSPSGWRRQFDGACIGQCRATPRSYRALAVLVREAYCTTTCLKWPECSSMRKAERRTQGRIHHRTQYCATSTGTNNDTVYHTSLARERPKQRNVPMGHGRSLKSAHGCIDERSDYHLTTHHRIHAMSRTNAAGRNRQQKETGHDMKQTMYFPKCQKQCKAAKGSSFTKSTLVRKQVRETKRNCNLPNIRYETGDMARTKRILLDVGRFCRAERRPEAPLAVRPGCFGLGCARADLVACICGIREISRGSLVICYPKGVYTFQYTSLYTYQYTYIHMYTYTCIHIHTYIHTHIHTYYIHNYA